MVERNEVVIASGHLSSPRETSNPSEPGEEIAAPPEEIVVFRKEALWRKSSFPLVLGPCLFVECFLQSQRQCSVQGWGSRSIMKFFVIWVPQ